MKTFVTSVLAAVASAELLSGMEYKFMRYVSQFNKFYDTVEEFEMRLQLFIRFDNFVERANARGTLYRAGHNKFSDWTSEEKDSLLGLKNVPMPEVDSEALNDDTVANVPSSWDWREQGAVTPVKDQGQCGSCWAFSTIEAVESAWIIQGNEMTIMSEQELVDCSSSAGNQGCNGGWYFWSYDWLATHMTMREDDYAYVSGTTKTAQTTCDYDESKGVTFVSGYGRTYGTAQNLKRLQQQPVNVAVAAGNDVFHGYSSGIITEADGCPQKIDHAIVAVGWGEENGTQYYIVRNSWGTSWGEDGYVRIATGGLLGVCGINEHVYYPTL